VSTPKPTLTPSPTATPTSTPGPGTIHIYEDGSGDYATLDEAVRAAYEGSTVIIGEGIYQLTAALEIDKALTLQGQGMDKTVVTGDSGEYVVRLAGAGPFVLEGITFQYEGAAWADVVAADEGEVSITDCRFTGAVYSEEEIAGGDGLFLSGIVSAQVRASRFDQNDLNGIALYQDAQAVLGDNLSTENGKDGITFWGSSGGQARRNESYGNGWDGIGVQEQAQPLLAQNVCDDNGRSGIGFYHEAAGAARGNQCSGNGEVGIRVIDEASPEVARNTCTGNPIGIHVGDTATPTLINNDCPDQAAPTPGFALARPAFGAITTSPDVDSDNHAVDPMTAFPEGTLRVYASFNYAGMGPDVEWTRTWYRDGAEVLSKTQVWDGKEEGRYEVHVFSTSGEPLLPASYEVHLFIEGELQQTASFVIGEP